VDPWRGGEPAERHDRLPGSVSDPTGATVERDDFREVSLGNLVVVKRVPGRDKCS
jgi:hypothetical protein